MKKDKNLNQYKFLRYTHNCYTPFINAIIKQIESNLKESYTALRIRGYRPKFSKEDK